MSDQLNEKLILFPFFSLQKNHSYPREIEESYNTSQPL